MKKSRFANVFATNEALAAEDQLEKKPRARRSEPKPRTHKPLMAQSKPAGEARRPGRPPGKRTSSDYQSVTTFLHKQTYLSVQKALVGADRDFGDVVDELLKAWLKQRP